METSRGSRGSGTHLQNGAVRGRGRGISKNKHWTAPNTGATDSTRWERGGHRGGGPGRGSPWPQSTRGGAQSSAFQPDDATTDDEDHNTEEVAEEVDEEPEVVDYQEVRELLCPAHGASYRVYSLLARKGSRSRTEKGHRRR